MRAFVSGLFPTRALAERVVRELVAAGFSREQISVAMSGETHARDFAGLAFGGTLAAIAQHLDACGTIAPRVELLATGPLARLLVGPVPDAFVAAGLPAYEAKYATGRILSGGILIGVHAEGDKKETARRILLLSSVGTLQLN